MINRRFRRDSIVPSKKGLIRMTFWTVPLEMYAPMVARESTETMIPPLNLKARVVVPLANLTAWCSSPVPHTELKFARQYDAGCAKTRRKRKGTVKIRRGK